MTMKSWRVALAGAVIVTWGSAAFAQEFGAIAYSPQTGLTGYALSPVSLQLARKTAMRRCSEKAGDCVDAVWTREGCAAVAGARGGLWGFGYAPEKRAAEQLAQTECRKRGPGCQVARSMCISSLY